MIKVKWICIKDYDTPTKIVSDGLYQPSFAFKVGDVCIIQQYSGDDIYIGKYTEGSNAIPFYRAEPKVFEHFITQAKWRDKQINSILDDDSEA